MKKIAYNFDMFIGYGLAKTDNIVNGLPWSFDFYDSSVTHENNNEYIISTDIETFTFRREDIIEVVDDVIKNVYFFSQYKSM